MSRIVPADTAHIAEAAEALRDGQLVVMPTETVYGLAADATSELALKRVFAAKGRPATHPLIAHIADYDMLAALTDDWTPIADALAARFWPGPLTIVVPKRATVSPILTGGHDTVAVRMPSHPVALRLIAAVGRPLAAPSANPFMALTPTRAEHVDTTLLAQTWGVLDGGPCEHGIESTVVTVSDAGTIAVLRPGAVSRADLAEIAPVAEGIGETASPGQHPRHYAPAVPVRLVEMLSPGAVGLGFGIATIDQIPMPTDPKAFAACLYSFVHEIAECQPPEIEIETPPRTSGWEAVWDRLTRMAAATPDGPQ
ncbi:MAG: L-threonylcarbamoyladenylate synthase [Fimbriimonadaceae bacterium]|nr:L-threonylcarbamoyladenylate synthase [Fimbriimonadaceae bacterium]